MKREPYRPPLAVSLAATALLWATARRVLPLLRDGRCGSRTILALALSAPLAYRFLVRPRLSNHVRRRIDIPLLRVCEVWSVLLLTGPLRLLLLLFGGKRDPRGIGGRLSRLARNLDARVLGVRPPIYVAARPAHITIPLRDGETTAATLFSPAVGDGDDDPPRPVVLVRTPYKRRNLWIWGVRFAERGYHFVAQDARGRFGSTGDFFPMLNEAADGADTIEWIAKQPWCNGDVGITGVSYLGLASWAAMREGVPHLKAVAPVLAATDLYNVLFGRGSGAAHVELMFRWSHLVIHLMNKPLGMLEAMFTFFMGTGKSLRNAYKHAPLREADTKFLCPDLDEPLEWMQDGLDHPLGTEPFWKDKRKFVDFEHMKRAPPVLLFAGWYDFFCSEQLHDFAALKKISSDCRLVVGPYTHWHIIAMEPKMFRTLFEFFDRHLLGDEGKALPPVQVYQLGDKMGWREMAAWPSSDASTKEFAFVRNDEGDNLLLEVEEGTSAARDEREVSYLYNPADPTPQIGGGTFNPSNCGRLDQSAVEERDDVLVFTSAPLEGPLTIAGEIIVSLTVESNVEGTDYVGRACHVTPDGKSVNVADGIVRKHDLKPGERTKVELTLSPVLNRLAAGDRLRVHVCSSAYPKYGRHLNTRESFHLETEDNALLSEQVLFLGGEEGCRCFVPIIP